MRRQQGFEELAVVGYAQVQQLVDNDEVLEA